MKQIVLVLFVLPLVGAVAWARPAAKADTLRLESSVVAMGSAYSVVVYGEDRTRMEEAVDAAFEEVQRLDQMLSNYKPESELSEINRYAGGAAGGGDAGNVRPAGGVRGIQPGE